MDWKKEAVNELKNYNTRKAGLNSALERIKILEENIASVKGASNKIPVKGGASRQEETLLNNIYQREVLALSCKTTKKMLDLVDEALAILSDKEKLILNHFYINRTRDYRDILCEELCCEESQLYRSKDEALAKFTRAMFGVTEI